MVTVATLRALRPDTFDEAAAALARDVGRARDAADDLRRAFAQVACEWTGTASSRAQERGQERALALDRWAEDGAGLSRVLGRAAERVVTARRAVDAAVAGAPAGVAVLTTARARGRWTRHRSGPAPTTRTSPQRPPR